MMRNRIAVTLVGFLLSHPCASAEEAAQVVRIATFNVALVGTRRGELIERLCGTDDDQASAVAEIIQRTRPDILLLNELDYDERAAAVTLFQRHYLARPQHVSRHPDGPAQPIEYGYRFIAPVNTGMPSGYDLNRDGVVGKVEGDSAYADDALGYGRYPGQYGMALLSRFPIDGAAVRTFQHFLWREMPDPMLPSDPATANEGDWYDDDILARFRLSSKSHWDVPLVIGASRLHILASHPTPPVFDGPEDRNGCRNHDEIRLWADHVRPDAGDYLVDDTGRRGGLMPGTLFVIAGDYNCDPHDGNATGNAIDQLLNSPLVYQGPAPRSAGGAEQARLLGGVNREHRGDPAEDTSLLPAAPGPGNLRLDYVLPCARLAVKASGVFWPTTDDPAFPLVAGADRPRSSDHRLVWVDVALPAPVCGSLEAEADGDRTVIGTE